MLIFVPMNDFPTPEVTCDNMVIVDADHIDRVVFDLIVNFERMIGRRIPNADLRHRREGLSRLSRRIHPQHGQRGEHCLT